MEVTVSPWIAPPPCFHGWSIILVFSFGCLGRPPLVARCPSLLWSRMAEDRIVLGDIFWQLGLSTLILKWFFILGVGLGLNMKWAEVARFLGPTIAPKNPIVRILGWGGGFWCPRAFVMACPVLSYVSARVFSPVQCTFLALWYTTCTHIKFWRLYTPHVQRCDGNLAVVIFCLYGRETPHSCFWLKV